MWAFWLRIPNYVALHINYIAILNEGLNFKDGSGGEKYRVVVLVQSIFEDLSLTQANSFKLMLSYATFRFAFFVFQQQSTDDINILECKYSSFRGGK